VAAAAWAGDGVEGRGRRGMEDVDDVPAARLQAAVPRLGPPWARLSARTMAGRMPMAAQRAVAMAAFQTLSKMVQSEEATFWRAGKGLGL
jgi:hypothetical protein